MILLLKCKIQFVFLDLKMISERSKRRQKILSLVFILKCVSKKLLIRITITIIIIIIIIIIIVAHGTG